MLRWLGRLLVGVAAAVGALMSSQFPEFAQQYRQRLGGALQEMRHIVGDFDAAAAEHNLTRTQALMRYSESSEPFLQNQRANVQRTIDRYEQLADQRARLDS